MTNQKKSKPQSEADEKPAVIEDILYSKAKRNLVLQKPYYQDAEGTKDKIHEAYLRYNLSRQNVIELTGAPVSVVDEWLYGPIDRTTGQRVNNGWFSEREGIRSASLKMMTKARGEALKSIVEMSTLIVTSKLNSLAAKGDEVSISEMKMVMEVLEKADNIVKVDEDKPTDIKKSVRLTSDSIKKKWDDLSKADPYGPYSKKKVEKKEPKSDA
jgi:hypothetical protein